MSDQTQIVIDTTRSLSIADFCVVEDMGEVKYFKMRNLGFGPDEMRTPGSNQVRISPEARTRWHKKLEKLANSPQVKRDKRKLVERGRNAGKAAVQSSRHPCQKNAKRAAREQRASA